MRLVVERHALAVAMAAAAKHVLHRTTLPILSTVLLRASDCELEITATDLDRLFKATIEARIEVEGLIAINASLLAGFVRDAVGRDVELALAASLLELRSGRARCCIPTLTAADFVEPFRDGKANAGFEIDGAVLADCLNSVRYAIPKEDPRYYLLGVAWSFQGNCIELAAADGHLLSMISMEKPAGTGELQPVIVPDFAMPKFTGAVRVDLSDTWIRFSGSAGHRMSITSKLIDGTFPDYRRMIKSAAATATVQRKALADAVSRCQPLCEASRAPIDLIHETEGELVVRVNGKDGARIEDCVKITGAQFALSLGGSLLAKTLDSFGGDAIEIGLVAVGEGVRFGDPGKDHRLAIIMPMVSRLTHRIGPPASHGGISLPGGRNAHHDSARDDYQAGWDR